MSLWKELSICLVKEGELFYEGGITASTLQNKRLVKYVNIKI